MKNSCSFLLVALISFPLAAQKPAADAEQRFRNGLLHLQEGRVELALEEFRQAVKADSKNAYFQKGLGVAYQRLADLCAPQDNACKQSRLKDAVAASRKALELNPYYADVHNDLGTALLRLGQRGEGRQELLKAYGDPQNPTPEFTARNLGQAYIEDKDYVEALKWYRSSIERNKGYSDAYVGAANALVALGRSDEAIAQLEAGLAATPEDVGVALALGEVLYRAGRFSDARTRLEKVAAKDPSGPAGRRALERLKNFPK